MICVLANFLLIFRGLSAGIEWFCVRAMPLDKLHGIPFETPDEKKDA